MPHTKTLASLLVLLISLADFGLSLQAAAISPADHTGHMRPLNTQGAGTKRKSNAQSARGRQLSRHRKKVKTDEKLPALARAARDGDLPAVEELLAKGVNVNEKDERVGWTALWWAILSDRPEIVEVLLTKGAEINMKPKRQNLTPLSFAVSLGRTAIIQALLDKGADANEKRDDGHTILMTAVSGGYVEIVKALLAEGAEVNANL